jgi:hypothetical protein
MIYSNNVLTLSSINYQQVDILTRFGRVTLLLVDI